MKGRKPEPAHLKLLRGNPGRRKLRQEVRPVGTPLPPPGMDGSALAEWQRITPRLLELGIVCDLDTAPLMAYCHAYAECLAGDASEVAWVRLRASCAELGLTPASRARLAIRSESEQKSALKQFIQDKKA